MNSRYALLPGLLAVLLACAVSGCLGRPWYFSIYADAAFSGRTLELPVSCYFDYGTYTAFHGVRFSSRITFEQLKEVAERECGEGAVTEYSDMLHIRMPGEDGRQDDYLLRATGQQGHKNHYDFGNMSAVIQSSSSSEEWYGILLPMYLIEDPEVFENQNIVPVLDSDGEYELRSEEGEGPDALKSRFAEFYEGSGWYAITAREGRLQLTENTDAAISWSLSFTEHDGKCYFSICRLDNQ